MAADPWIVLAAAAVEGVFGYPRRLPHPVVWIGAALRRLDAALNRGGDARRRAGGVLTLLIVAGLAGGAGWWLDRFLHGWTLILTIALGSRASPPAASTTTWRRSARRWTLTRTCPPPAPPWP